MGLRNGSPSLLYAFYLLLENLFGLLFELCPYERVEVGSRYVVLDVHDVQLGAALLRDVDRSLRREGRVLGTVGGQ